MELPDQMPQGCNFYGLLQTSLTPELVARRFADAGWRVAPSADNVGLEIGWGRLSLLGGDPLVIQGRLKLPGDRVGEVLGLLRGREIEGAYQWINAEGQLWRELPFDESMLDPNDLRLPAEIKASVLASHVGSAIGCKARKPWWRFW